MLIWDLLNNNGIIIFDNYNCKQIVEKELYPLFAIEYFIKIYTNNIKILVKENSNNIIIQKIYNKFDKKNISVHSIFKNILNYDIPKKKYSLPFQKYKKINFDLEYYENNIDIYIFDDIITEPLFNELLEYNITKSPSDIFKYITELDYNYFIHRKYDKIKFIKYIEQYLYTKFEKTIKGMIEPYLITGTINSLYNIEEYDEIAKLKSKNINIFQIGWKQQNAVQKWKWKGYGNDYTNYLNNKYNKNINQYQIYPRIISDNIFTLNDFMLMPNNLNSYEEIEKLISFFKNKKIQLDLINFNSMEIIKFIQNNQILQIIDLKEFNYIYLYILYFSLSIQKKNGYLKLSLFPLFNNIYYEILYILSIYYDNITIKYLNIQTSNLSVRIICSKFRGIDKNELTKIQNICKNINKEKPIKTIINNEINQHFLEVSKKVLIEILKNKIINFSNKYKFIMELPNLSEESKKNYFYKIFQKQILFYLKYLNKYKIDL